MNELSAQVQSRQASSEFASGETVAESGIYRLLHAEHGQPREFIFLRGARFPACPRCRGDITFQLVMSAPYIGDDPDFADLA